MAAPPSPVPAAAPRRRLRSLLRLAFLLLLLGASIAAYVSWAPVGDAAPHPFNQDRNAVWLEHRWLERQHSTAEMEELVTALAARGIVYVYPHLIPFNNAGRLPVHSREQMRTFLEVARRLAPA